MVPQVHPELMAQYPVLGMLVDFATLLFFFAILWVFGRMGDNINKIRKMLEQEIKNRQNS